MMDHTRIYLIRHGQVNGFENYPIYGHTDVPLTEIGILQMESTAERLRLMDISAIYTSDLQRAHTGAKIISKYHDVQIHVMPELKEMYFGNWEGLPLERIRSDYPEELQKRQQDLLHYSAPGNGETIEKFAKRILNCTKKILHKHQNQQIIIVAHGGVNRVIICHALGLEFDKMFHLQQDYGCLNIIDYYPDNTLVRLING